MRTFLAAGTVALLTATPAAALNGGHGVWDALRASSALHHSRLAAVDESAPKTRTCQAGKHKGGVTKGTLFVGERGKPGVVACEQPPKSDPVTADSIAKATAAALAWLG